MRERSLHSQQLVNFYSLRHLFLPSVTFFYLRHLFLKAILAHNRDEEKEHAAILLEWIRRKDKRFDKELKDYLFSEAPISKLEGQHHD